MLCTYVIMGHGLQLLCKVRKRSFLILTCLLTTVETRLPPLVIFFLIFWLSHNLTLTSSLSPAYLILVYLSSYVNNSPIDFLILSVVTCVVDNLSSWISSD
ncbi:hypothetical protein GGR53DRAFT_489535 [Hypoxylon sp. FL1150]|nr:hypothetical protein GGR53DRAFT_489535 [Hypoxylon sp. FL1150]